MIIRACVVAFTMVLALPASAQSVKLTSEQITNLFTGNTAVGKWNGIPYRQYFGADGMTIYAQEGSFSKQGEWRVDATADEFQSIWPNDLDWEGWVVIEYAGAYYWASKITPPTPFKIVEGQQLVE